MRAGIGRALASGLLVVSSAVGLGFTAAPAGAAPAARSAESTCGVLRWQQRDFQKLVTSHKRAAARATRSSERKKYQTWQRNAQRGLDRINTQLRANRCR